ncbi:MAG: hypothetical protein JWP01_4027 [Myxococcales bacterium]|nr:hypothetical protein [Myxococcales bacterium]
MRGAWLVIVGTSGCGFTTPVGTGIDAGDVADGMTDAPEVDAPLADAFSFDVNPTLCYGGPGAFQLCLPAAPTAPLTLSGTIDTSVCANGIVVSPSVTAPDVCVIAGATVTVPGMVRVIGMRPLAVVASGTMTIAGTIDVSSVRGGQRGAGANHPCAMASAPGTAGNGDGGGGSGGSFQTRGGLGGGGGGGGVGGSIPPAPATSPFVRGGCRGRGGGGSGGGSGDSGGAVYLVAAGALDLSGTINASGAGGAGSTGPRGGGGGGGSGGMIALYGAPLTVRPTASVFANGGGGGGGGGPNFIGGNGGQSSASNVAGPAGTGDGTGGLGSLMLGNGGGGSQGGKGGGGGGGGAGVIENLTGGAISSGTFSPPAS